MVASMKTLVPEGTSDNRFAPSAVKKAVLFGEQLPDLAWRQRETPPGLCHNSSRPADGGLAVEVLSESVAHHVGDLPALAAGLVACAVVQAFVEKSAELPAHNIMTIS